MGKDEGNGGWECGVYSVGATENHREGERGDTRVCGGNGRRLVWIKNASMGNG